MLEKKSRKIDWTVVIILIFTFILGVYQLGVRELEIDEYFSLHISQHPISDILMLNNNYGYWYMNNLPPFYEFFLNLWARIFGSSVLAYRFPSVIFNVIFILFVFKMGKLLVDREAGYLSATLASFTLGFIFYSRFIRCYSLLNMLVTVSFYILFKMLKQNGFNKKNGIALAVINIATIYTHYTGFLVLLFEALLIIVLRNDRKNKYRDIPYAAIIPLGCYMPWYKYFFIHIIKENTVQQIYYNSSYLQRLYVVLRDGVFGTNAILLIYAILLLYFSGRYLLKNRLQKDDLFDKKALLAVLLVLIGSIVLVNLVNADTRSFRMKYFLAYLFPLFVISGYSVCNLPKRLGLAVFMILLILSGRQVCDFYENSVFRWPNTQLRKIISNIRPYEKKGLTIFIEDNMYIPLFAYYYWNPGLAYKMSTPRYGYKANIFLEEIKSSVRIYGNVRGPLKIDGVVKGGGSDFAIWRWREAIEAALERRWFLVLGTRGAKDFFDKTDEEIKKEENQNKIQIKLAKEFRVVGYQGSLYEIILQR
ncbi:MAG: glycosyltransferase family 39 protein [Candidatus Omnitrophica bacterium]|nr:glycosyltransferase family 39 protein [Candidatus Omnitrophota bacterium]MBU1925751.1 glycosyltransferase family 39 protein [Candidatus Omnitrophota bacterium]